MRTAGAVDGGAVVDAAVATLVETSGELDTLIPVAYTGGVSA